ncbi:MAG: glycosyltransferase family 4 protein [Gaiellaceae bacterium]
MVGISLLTLVPGVVGGTETYARAICRALHEHGELEYNAFLPSLSPDAAGPMSSSVVAGYPASAGTAGRLAAVARATYAPRSIASHMSTAGLRAMHFPLTTEVPRLQGIPTIVTVHDLQHLVLPAFFSRAERMYRRLIYAPSIRRARAVIAISQHVKNTVIELLEIPAEKITVSHFGLDHSTLKPDSFEREPFIIYPANRWPHKNHARLIDALDELRRTRPEMRLVLTGAGHDNMPAHDGVEILGLVPRDKLVRLYQTASALVFPSLYEGFGQPPLEAMACGCPVACSDAAALPEVCGDAARYFDPYDSAAIAEAMDHVLHNTEEYRARGIVRARGFTWEQAARTHENVYERVVAG